MERALKPIRHTAAELQRQRNSPRAGWLQRHGIGIGGMACVLGALALVTVGALLMGSAAAPLRVPEEDQTARHARATITFGREGHLCRQATIDNRTGRMEDKGLVACETQSAGESPERLRERHTGARMDSIRNSFMSR